MTVQSSSFYGVLQCFSLCFTEPSFQNLVSIAVGWIICRERHTITGPVRVALSLGVERHHSVFYRFFSKAAWVPDALGKALFDELLSFIPGPIVEALTDDTLGRKTGPHIWGAGMHHDAVASSYGRHTGRARHVAFAFGHSWVIVAIWVPLPWNLVKGVAIPLLFRLYRSKKLCPPQEYRKRTELALELVQILEKWVVSAGRKLVLTGDSEYACRTIVKRLPATTHFIGPVVMNAALFKVPAPSEPSEKRGRGAPRKRGDRLPTPKQLLSDSSCPWIKITATLYGRSVPILVKTLVCQWYQVAGLRPVRIVLTRDPKRRIDDRAFFSTDSEMTADQVLTLFSHRWSLEVTFFNTKQHFGLEHPQNGWGYLKNRRRSKKRAGPQPRGTKGQKAAQRTTPCIFYLFGLIYVWYFKHGNPKRDVAIAQRLAPWNTRKTEPSFRDVLDALRRELISCPELRMHPDHERVMQQFGSAEEPLMDAA